MCQPRRGTLGTYVVYGIWWKRAFLQQRALRSALCTYPAPSDNPGSGRCYSAPAPRTALICDRHRCTPPPPCPLIATAISLAPAACEIQPARPCRAPVPAAPPLPPFRTFRASPFAQAAWRVPRMEPFYIHVVMSKMALEIDLKTARRISIKRIRSYKVHGRTSCNNR